VGPAPGANAPGVVLHASSLSSSFFRRRPDRGFEIFNKLLGGFEAVGTFDFPDMAPMTKDMVFLTLGFLQFTRPQTTRAVASERGRAR
jgi:hypothetical protein